MFAKNAAEVLYKNNVTCLQLYAPFDLSTSNWYASLISWPSFALLSPVLYTTLFIMRHDSK